MERSSDDPDTRYADADGVKIAYQVTGAGPDLVVVPGFVSHVDLWWRDPKRRQFLRAISGFSRLVRYDKRGTGLSDPATEPPTLDMRMAELDAVISAADCPRPILFGWSEGGPIAVQYAVARPDRVAGLILYGTFARKPPASVTRVAFKLIDEWGTGASIDLFGPSLRDDPDARRQAALFERASASPAMARALAVTVARTEVRSLLPRVGVATLVLHRTGDVIPVAEGRAIARAIPNARLVELEGNDHNPWLGDTSSLLGEVAAFVAAHGGAAPVAGPGARRPRRPLSGWSSLTPAELRVARAAAAGLANPEIASELFLSRYTVETHLKRVFAKLGVASRSELVSVAMRNT